MFVGWKNIFLVVFCFLSVMAGSNANDSSLFWSSSSSDRKTQSYSSSKITKDRNNSSFTSSPFIDSPLYTPQASSTSILEGVFGNLFSGFSSIFGNIFGIFSGGQNYRSEVPNTYSRPRKQTSYKKKSTPKYYVREETEKNGKKHIKNINIANRELTLKASWIKVIDKNGNTSRLKKGTKIKVIRGYDPRSDNISGLDRNFVKIKTSDGKTFFTHNSNLKGFNLEELKSKKQSLSEVAEAASYAVDSIKEGPDLKYSCDSKNTIKDYMDDTQSTKRKGCGVLVKAPHYNKGNDRKKLMQCITSIKKFIVRSDVMRNGQIIRKKMFHKMLTKLTPKEQEFAAYIFTATGEADSQSKKHMAMVMQVIQNRKRWAIEGGKWKKPFNALDIVLQKLQFSMYNGKPDPNLDRVFKRSVKFGDMIDAYIDWPRHVKSFGPDAFLASHYHAKSMKKPKWAKRPTRAPFGTKARLKGLYRGHIFYKYIDNGPRLSPRKAKNIKYGWGQSQSRELQKTRGWRNIRRKRYH